MKYVIMTGRDVHSVAAGAHRLWVTSTGTDEVLELPLDDLGRVWVPLLVAQHVPHVGIHALRHSAAARMIGAGWGPKAVQQTLGHASAAFTMTVYGHLFDDDLDTLANALDAPSRGLSADSRPVQSVR